MVPNARIRGPNREVIVTEQLSTPRIVDAQSEQFHPWAFDPFYADPPQELTAGQKVAMISAAVLLGVCAAILAVTFGPGGGEARVAGAAVGLPPTTVANSPLLLGRSPATG